MAGRPKQSAALLQLKGTDQKCRMQNRESDIDVEKFKTLPSCRGDLKGRAKKIYELSGKMLVEMELLDNLNLPLFIAFCNEMGLYFDFQKDLKKEPRLVECLTAVYDTIETYTLDGRKLKDKIFKGTIVEKYMINPKVKMSNMHLDNARKIAVEFGMTPAALSKVHIPEKKEEDELAKFLNNAD